MKAHNPSNFNDPDWHPRHLPTTTRALTAFQREHVDTLHYKQMARAVLDNGSMSNNPQLDPRLICIGEAYNGMLWWKKVVGFRAIVADSGLWARSGVQSSPLAAVEAAVINLYTNPGA